MNTNYASELQQQIKILIDLGHAVMPAIKDDSNPSLVTGKVPSSIKPNGTTIPLRGRYGWLLPDLLDQIQLAERFGKPFGIAIQPPNNQLIIDLDLGNYSGGEAELMDDYHRLLEICPELHNTRTERTTSGGLHIYVKVSDLEGWRQDNGSLRKNLTTLPSGLH